MELHLVVRDFFIHHAVRDHAVVGILLEKIHEIRLLILLAFPFSASLNAKSSIADVNNLIVIDVVFHIVLVKGMTYAHCYMVGKIYRHSISNHLIAHVDVFINELEIIRECLQTCYFPDSHPTV